MFQSAHTSASGSGSSSHGSAEGFSRPYHDSLGHYDNPISHYDNPRSLPVDQSAIR